MSADLLTPWLKKQTKAQLIKLIEAHCAEDADFLESLQLQAAAATPKKNLDKIKRSIRNAYWIDDFVHWNETNSYSCKLDKVTETLRTLIEKGQSAMVIELVEYAMDCWVEAIQSIDDSDGGMGMALDELHELHLCACRNAAPDPETLAEDLFTIGRTSKWESFYSAYTAYASVWREVGKQRYRQLVEADWNKLPQLKPGKEDPQQYENKSRWLSNLMIQFAKEDGDFERELTLRQRDLSNAWNFLKIAERCEEENEIDQTLEWVDAGLKHFTDDKRLLEKQAELYWALERCDDALAVWWRLFENNRTLETYSRLVTRARERRQVAQWQSKALDSIRADIAQRKKTNNQWTIATHSLLVELFLWEGDIEQAWREAVDGDCAKALWLQLCEKREKEHPEEVYPIYLKLAAGEVTLKKNDAYRYAVRLISKARKLAARVEQIEAYQAGFRKIKLTHKAKRNFMKYLSEAGL